MKFSKFIFTCVLCLYICNLKSQDNIYNSKLGLIVKTDILAPPLFWLIGGAPAYSLSVEKLLGSRQSFQLSGNFGYSNSLDYSSNQFRYFIYQIIPEYRFYLNKQKIQKGIYCGPYSKLIDGHGYELVGGYEDKYLYRSIELGALSGYQIYPLKHCVVDFLLGLGVRKIIYDKRIDSSPQADFPETDIKQRQYLFGRLSLNIGYVFY